MALFSVSFDGTRVTNADSITGWTNEDGTETEFVYQGTVSISSQIKTGLEYFYYTAGTTIDFTAGRGKMWLAKIFASTKALLSYEGFRTRIGDSSTTYAEHYHFTPQDLNKIYPIPGGYQLLSIDPNVGGWVDFVSLTKPSLSAVDVYQIGAEFTASTKTQNVAIDAIDVVDVGEGLSATGGDGANTDGTFQDFVDYDEGIKANRYGIIQTRDGIVYVNAMLRIANNSTNTEFTDSNRVLVFNSQKVGANSVGIVFDLQNTATSMNISKTTFRGAGKPQFLYGVDNRPSYTFLGASGSASVTESTFSTFKNMELTNACSLTGSKFLGGEYVNINAANLVGATAANYNPFDFSSALAYAPTQVIANNASSNNYIFPNIEIGEARNDRSMVLMFRAKVTTTANCVLTQATVNGSNATVQASVGTGTGTDRSTTYIASVNAITTGTTANITIAFSTATTPAGIVLSPYICYGMNTAVFSSAEATSNTTTPPANISLTTDANTGGSITFIGISKQHNSGLDIDGGGTGEIQEFEMYNWESTYTDQDFCGHGRKEQYSTETHEIVSIGTSGTLGGVAGTFQRDPVTTDRSYFIWNVNINPTGYLDNMTFTRGSHVHHAIEFGTSSPTTLNLNGLTFSGYGADDTFSAAVYIARTSGTVTINASGCTGLTYKSAGADVTVVSDPVTVRVDTRDINNNAVSAARVYLRAANGDGPFPFEDVVTITNSGTTATVAHTAHGMATNDKVLIAGASHIQNRGVHQITVANTTHYTYTMSSAPGSDPTGTITSTFVALEGNTVSGFLSASRVYSANQAVTGVARKATGTPYYKTSILSGTITSTDGFQQTAIMISDE